MAEAKGTPKDVESGTGRTLSHWYAHPLLLPSEVYVDPIPGACSLTKASQRPKLSNISTLDQAQQKTPTE